MKSTIDFYTNENTNRNEINTYYKKVFPHLFSLSTNKDNTINKILKSTKSILLKSKTYRKYQNEYQYKTQIPSFKYPDVDNYPLYTQSELIPSAKKTFISSFTSILNRKNNNQNKTKPVSEFIITGTNQTCKTKYKDVQFNNTNTYYSTNQNYTKLADVKFSYENTYEIYNQKQNFDKSNQLYIEDLFDMVSEELYSEKSNRFILKKNTYNKEKEETKTCKNQEISYMNLKIKSQSKKKNINLSKKKIMEFSSSIKNDDNEQDDYFEFGKDDENKENKNEKSSEDSELLSIKEIPIVDDNNRLLKDDLKDFLSKEKNILFSKIHSKRNYNTCSSTSSNCHFFDNLSISLKSYTIYFFKESTEKSNKELCLSSSNSPLKFSFKLSFILGLVLSRLNYKLFLQVLTKYFQLEGETIKISKDYVNDIVKLSDDIKEIQDIMNKDTPIDKYQKSKNIIKKFWITENNLYSVYILSPEIIFSIGDFIIKDDIKLKSMENLIYSDFKNWEKEAFSNLLEKEQFRFYFMKIKYEYTSIYSSLCQIEIRETDKSSTNINKIDNLNDLNNEVNNEKNTISTSTCNYKFQPKIVLNISNYSKLKRINKLNNSFFSYKGYQILDQVFTLNYEQYENFMKENLCHRKETLDDCIEEVSLNSIEFIYFYITNKSKNLLMQLFSYSAVSKMKNHFEIECFSSHPFYFSFDYFSHFKNINSIIPIEKFVDRILFFNGNNKKLIINENIQKIVCKNMNFIINTLKSSGKLKKNHKTIEEDVFYSQREIGFKSKTIKSFKELNSNELSNNEYSIICLKPYIKINNFSDETDEMTNIIEIENNNEMLDMLSHQTKFIGFAQVLFKYRSIYISSLKPKLNKSSTKSKFILFLYIILL